MNYSPSIENRKVWATNSLVSNAQSLVRILFSNPNPHPLPHNSHPTPDIPANVHLWHISHRNRSIVKVTTCSLLCAKVVVETDIVMPSQWQKLRPNQDVLDEVLEKVTSGRFFELSN